LAGYIQNDTQIIIAKTRDKIIQKSLLIIVYGVALLNNNIIASHKIIQTNHQIMVSMILSIKNWSKMSFFLAQIDFIIPISRLRSATPAYIIFIIQIPDTTSTIAQIQISRYFVTSAAALAIIRIDHWSST
jgi:hypothetical protein